MAERKANLLERFLFGPNVNRGIEEKGLFEFQPGMASPITWVTPNGDGITYGGTIDYAVATEDVIDNSAVMACLWWICTTFPEARLRVMKRSADGARDTEIPRHPLTLLWNRPNPYYSGRLGMQPGLISYNWRGETFYRIVRNGSGQPIQLYYEPHWTCRPIRRNADEFISGYQLYRDYQWVDVPLEDILHIRAGIDPENPMHGLSRLASALREVYTDNEAARYASVMFRNLGVVGGVVTPKSGDDEIGDPNRLKAELQALTTGDNRGKFLVYSLPLDMQFPQTDASKMDTRQNRKITEERISALLGVPAIVAGLGAGLDRSTFANMSEAREMAYESNIIPTQQIWADELNNQLLPQLGNPETEYVDWDYSQVRVLQADENAKAQRWVTLYQGGIAKLSEARADLDLPTGPDEDTYKQAAPSPFSAGAQDMPQDAPQGAGGGDAGKALMSAQGKARAPKAERARIEREIQKDVDRIIMDAYEEVAGQ